MDKFRRGDVNVLVCTNALEEGVDVSDAWSKNHRVVLEVHGSGIGFSHVSLHVYLKISQLDVFFPHIDPMVSWMFFFDWLYPP